MLLRVFHILLKYQDNCLLQKASSEWTLSRTNECLPSTIPSQQGSPGDFGSAIFLRLQNAVHVISRYNPCYSPFLCLILFMLFFMIIESLKPIHESSQMGNHPIQFNYTPITDFFMDCTLFRLMHNLGYPYLFQWHSSKNWTIYCSSCSGDDILLIFHHTNTKVSFGRWYFGKLSN